MSKDDLQRGFSVAYGNAVFDAEARARKARKALAVIQAQYPHTENMDLLDIGCAAGFGTKFYAERFRSVIGIDVDEQAVRFAANKNTSPNTRYLIMDSQSIGFPDASFDVIICTHVYEHVPSASKLMSEINRLLRVGGACFFAAGNRLSLIEPHYRLPLLSVVPKWLAHLYLRMLGRGKFYYETHLTYWGLKKLVSKFEVIDYTAEIVKHPARFHAADVVLPGSAKQAISLVALRLAYWACPTYLWLLRKTK